MAEFLGTRLTVGNDLNLQRLINSHTLKDKEICCYSQAEFKQSFTPRITLHYSFCIALLSPVDSKTMSTFFEQNLVAEPS